MKTALIVKLKNIFMHITLIWSSVMLAVYLVVLIELPFFAWISYLPLGEEFCQFLSFLMLLGIWIIPVLYVIMITLMIIVHIKRKEENQNKRIVILSVVLPLILAGLMLLTNFMELLA